MPGSRYPTVSKQAEIDALATALVKRCFFSGWIVRDQQPDYHVDYQIECVEKGELTGERFCAQQKAHKKVRFRNGLALAPLKTKHLRYYAEKERQPVFLLLVDTSAERAYYLFVQEWPDRHADASKLRNHAKLSLPVSQENRLDEPEGFRRAFTASLAYMRRKYPGTIDDAISHEIRQIRSRHSDWDVRIDVINAKPHYHLFPRTESRVTLNVSGTAATALKDLFEFGKPFTACGGGIEISGPPILDELMARSGGVASVSISPEKNHRAELCLWADKPGDVRLTLPGTVTTGVAGIGFQSCLEGAPLFVEMNIARAAFESRRPQATMRIVWRFNCWEKRPVTALPYFEQLHALCQSILADQRIRHEFTIDGIRMGRGHLGTPEVREPFVTAAGVLENVDKVRRISERMNRSIPFPAIGAVQPEDLHTIELVTGILERGQYTYLGRGLRLEGAVELDPGEATQAISRFESLPDIRCEWACHETHSIFGVPLDLGELRFSLAGATGTVIEPSRSDFLAGKTRLVTVRLDSTVTSEFRVERASEPGGQVGSI